MKSCYVVERNIPDTTDERNIESCVQALTENLFLAEKVIANYYTSAFGEDGGRLICTLDPYWGTQRVYRMEAHYNLKSATFFTVYEEEIKDDSALL